MSAEHRIKSRPPTGRVPHPCVLIEGEEKAGKTYRMYELMGDPRVGRCYVIDLGEGSADEYAPLGDYEVVDFSETGFTYVALLEQVAAIRDFAQEQHAAGEKPVVLGLDGMHGEWNVLVDAITAKASTSERNIKALRADPAAEVKVPNHLWNAANAKHRRLMTMLLTFPGIVVMTSRGKEVAEIRNGAPVEGSKVWKVEGQKNMAFDATCWIRMKRKTPATLEGARSLRIGVRPDIDEPRPMDERWDEGGLGWFIFEAYGYDPANTEVRDLQELTDNGADLELPELPDGVPVLSAAEFLEQRVVPVWNDGVALQKAYAELNVRGLYAHQVPGPDGAAIALGALVAGRGQSLVDAEKGVVAPQPPQEASVAPVDAPSPEEAALLVDLVGRLAAATTLAEARAVWPHSTPVRTLMVNDVRLGSLTFGALYMARCGELASADAPRDHAERAAADDTRQPALVGG